MLATEGVEKSISVVDQQPGKALITDDLILIMKNTQANWKVRTQTIDQMHETIKNAVNHKQYQINL